MYLSGGWGVKEKSQLPPPTQDNFWNIPYSIVCAHIFLAKKNHGFHLLETNDSPYLTESEFHRYIGAQNNKNELAMLC